MSCGTFTYVENVWNWLRSHDIPNWIASLLLPLVVVWWQSRRVNSVLGLAVHFTPSAGQISIGPIQHPAVIVHFINYTGAVVYITGMWVKPNKNNFPIPSDAGRDAARGKFLVAFADSGQYRLRELTLQTNGTAEAAFALVVQLSDEFYKYEAPLWRRALRQPKYFRLEYVAMIGTKRRSIAMIH